MAPSPKNRILSGVQPTGNLHLGNYLGAIRNWVGLQNSHECLFMLADLHAITVPQDPAQLRANVRETAAAYIACGIDPARSAIFPQSSVAAHAELAWILSCHTPLGWLNRMTQFKEKAQTSKKGVEKLVKEVKQHLKKAKKTIEYINSRHSVDPASRNILQHHLQDQVQAILPEELDELEKATDEVLSDIEKSAQATLGLFSYPVLMAADILLYKATHVPVGEDQKQHLELCRDIAGVFNRHYKTEFFPLPEPVILGQAARVMSLRDGTKKMSKSDESDYSRINLTDDADAIAKKIKKATSDSFATIGESNDTRPEAANLMTLYASLKCISREEALAECGDKNFSAFKQMLTDVAVAHLSPITAKMRELLAVPEHLDKVLADGVARAQVIAGQTMREVKELIGFL